MTDQPYCTECLTPLASWDEPHTMADCLEREAQVALARTEDRPPTVTKEDRMMMLADTELLAQVWVGDGDDGGLERCVIEVERVDADELRIGIRETEEDCTDVYIARDRALKLGHALIEQALKEWRA